MRFLKVRANRFGALVDQALRLLGGLNVIHGPNEAGKSTWHAALFLGLCGRRRGKGQPKKVDRWMWRYKPWTGTGWAAGAKVAMRDDSTVELRHDLRSGQGKAVDADFPDRELSGDLIFEGAVDGSRMIGLNRRSFLNTAAVRQSQVTAIANDEDELKKALQSAAATAESDQTAAAALARLDAYHREYVGTERAPTKPLMSSRRKVTRIRKKLTAAREKHRAWRERRKRLYRLRDKAERAKRRVRMVEAVEAQRRAGSLANSVRKADDLVMHLPEGRPRPPGDDRLAGKVAAALQAWKARPDSGAMADPEGPTVRECEERVEAARMRQRVAEAALAAADAEAAQNRLEEAETILARFPDGPPRITQADDALANEVDRALRAWDGRPDPQALAAPEGATTDDLAARVREHRRRRHTLRAAWALRKADDARKVVRRVEKLAGRFPDGAPRSRTAEMATVSRALDQWKERPRSPDLVMPEGPSAEEIEAKRKAAEGRADLLRAAAARVRADMAADRLRRAEELAEASPDGAPGRPAASAELAERVAGAIAAWEALPSVPPETTPTAMELEGRLASVAARIPLPAATRLNPVFRWMSWGACLLLAAALASLVTGRLPLGGVIAGAGIVLFIAVYWKRLRVARLAARRARLKRERNRLSARLQDAQRRDAERKRRQEQRRLAEARLREVAADLGVGPGEESPPALLVASIGAWREERLGKLRHAAATREAKARRLGKDLPDGAVRGQIGSAEELDDAERKSRRAVAELAYRLAQRRAVEERVRRLRAWRLDARTALRRAAAEVGVRDTAPAEELRRDLEGFLRKSRATQRARATDWDHLQQLAGGRTIAELRAHATEVKRLAEQRMREPELLNGEEVRRIAAKGISREELEERSQALKRSYRKAERKEAARKAADAAVHQARQRMGSISVLLREVSRKCRIPDAAPESLAAGLDQWRDQRRKRLEAHERESGHWDRLQQLTGGAPVEELRADAAGLAVVAERRVKGLAPDVRKDVDRLAGEGITSARVDEVRKKSAAEERKHRELRAKRRAAEDRVREARGRMEDARRTVRATARQVGVTGAEAPALVEGLRRWEEGRKERFARHARQTRRWERLQQLTGGRPLADLQTRAVEAGEEAAALARGIRRDDLEETAREDPDRTALQERSRELADRVTRGEGELEQMENGLPPLAELEDELAEAIAVRDRYERLDKVLATTRRFLERAQDKAHRDIAPRLRRSVEKWLPIVTAGRYVKCWVNPESLAVTVSGPSGARREATRLSSGTAEQIYLLVRLAMTRELTRNGEPCPLILDDTLAGCDAERTRLVLDTLLAMSAETQVILFTHDTQVRDWARENCREAPHQLIELDPPRAMP